MKHFISSLLALSMLVSALCLTSCNKEEPSDPETEAPATETETETVAATETQLKLETLPLETDAPETRRPKGEIGSLSYLVDIDSIESDTPHYSDEGPDGLFDESEFSKWCLAFKTASLPTFTFKTVSPVRVEGFQMWTGNDTEKYPYRNPKHVILSASEDDGITWTVIFDDDVQMPGENMTCSDTFELEDKTGVYSMFKVEVTEIVGNGPEEELQISEFTLIGCEV